VRETASFCCTSVWTKQGPATVCKAVWMDLEAQTRRKPIGKIQDYAGPGHRYASGYCVTFRSPL